MFGSPGQREASDATGFASAEADGGPARLERAAQPPPQAPSARRWAWPADVHVSAAITYTLLVLLAGLLAKGNKTGREGLIRVAIASGIMIAPQIGPGAFLLLLSPDHIGTGVPLLLVFLLLDRAPRSRW